MSRARELAKLNPTAALALQALVGAAGKFPCFTADDEFRLADILGTVAQSGGVPMGAVFERGSNANGEYVKYADGTMICTLSISVTDQAINTAYTAGFYQGTRSWTFPAVFAAAPSVSCGTFRWGSSAAWSTLGGSTSSTGAVLRGIDTTSRATGTATAIEATAHGRWF